MLGILRAAVVSQAVLTGDVDADKEERAMGLLTINVGREYVSVVGHAKTAKEAWEKLKRKCEAHSTVQKLLLRKRYNKMQQEERETVQAWGVRLARALEELEDVGEPVRLEERKMKYLEGLREEYFNATQSLITSSIDEPGTTLEKVMEKMELVEQMQSRAAEGAAGRKGKGTEVPALSALGGEGGSRGDDGSRDGGRKKERRTLPRRKRDLRKRGFVSP